MGGRLPSVEH